MSSDMATIDLPPLDGPHSNANDFMAWLQGRPAEEEVRAAQALFRRILEVASQPRNSTKDACVKLCGFVQLCLKSQNESLRRWALSEETSHDLFNYYIEWNEKDQHRSMRLVLDLLSTILLQTPDVQACEALKADFLTTLVSIVARKSTRPLVKSCMSALTLFLTKSVLTLKNIQGHYQKIRPELDGKPAIVLWQHWTLEIFRWMELHYICPVAGKFLVTIFIELHSSSQDSNQDEKVEFNVVILRQWLESALGTNPDVLESVKNYVLAPLFKSDRGLSMSLLEELNKIHKNDIKRSDDTDTAALLHLAALEVGKKAAIVDDPSPIGGRQAANVVILDREILERFLIHSSHDVRSFAMSLLITSSSTTKPYSPMAFGLLRKHLRSCHADPDAKFRNEILAHSKNMVKRVKGAVSVLQKDICRLAIKASKVDANGTPVNTHIGRGAKQIANAGEMWLRDTLKDHENFYTWYLDFLAHELLPTASYQRHITSLKSLVNILRLGKESPGLAEQSLHQKPQWIRIILDLVMDPFDDVRETATALLMLYPSDCIQAEVSYGGERTRSSPLKILEEFCARASDLASRTSRADHSDGIARALGLLCAWQKALTPRLSLLSQILDDLEHKIELAEKDLGQAVMAVPVHGTFAAIRYMWEVLTQSCYSTDELQLLFEVESRIIKLCSRIWDAVSYVLCDDSPEGHLPEELEEIEGLDTKSLLSYSFRAIHESSNLMRTIVGNLRLSRNAGYLLPSPKVFRDAGNLAFTQLSRLRHRGAFSSVSLTFTCCCQYSQSPAVTVSTENRALLAEWYQGTLNCIRTQRSTTRRSAGIPAMMTGILASNADTPSFKEVMTTLQEIAARPAWVSETDGSNLSQVHAFNCLKEVFKSSLLSKNAELYLAECLQLATTSLKSEVWAIRNCALLLLRSLIDNLFGTNESKTAMEMGWDGKTLRISYTKYSSLPPILLSLLKGGEQAMEPGTLTQSSAAESVFPALEIIRRAGPPESHREELYRHISKYLGSRQWHVREIAARTLCSFLLNEDWLSSMEGMLTTSRGSANRMHGTLLTIKFFVERTCLELKEEEILERTQDLAAILEKFQRDAQLCSETSAAHLEILNLLNELDSSDLIRSSTSGSSRGSNFQSKALLSNRSGILRLRNAASTSDFEALRSCLFEALQSDIDTACALLEATATIWVSEDQTDLLCRLYLDICQETIAPEAKAIALTNLAEVLDGSISEGKIKDITAASDILASVFQHMQSDRINPALANAALLASGPLISTVARQYHRETAFWQFDHRLRAWGKMIADALHDSNTFDMRMAATRAVLSFANASRIIRAQDGGYQSSTTPFQDSNTFAFGSDAAFLPFFLALYTTLIDDDEEIREIGAMAMAQVTSSSSTPAQPVVAIDAADALLTWLSAIFGQTNEFRAYVCCRLVGSPLVTIDIGMQDLQSWSSPDEQFAEAFHVDESLFAVEEQNLFIDEVRETDRWAAVFRNLPWEYDEVEDDDAGQIVRRVLIMDSSLSEIRKWTEDALRILANQTTQHDDGPLGWASNPAAFALCHRVLVCGKVLSGLLSNSSSNSSGGGSVGHDGSKDTVTRLLARIEEVCHESRLHGLLASTLVVNVLGGDVRKESE